MAILDAIRAGTDLQRIPAACIIEDAVDGSWVVTGQNGVVIAASARQCSYCDAMR